MRLPNDMLAGLRVGGLPSLFIHLAKRLVSYFMPENKYETGIQVEKCATPRGEAMT